MTQQPTVGRIVHYQSYGTPGGEYLPEPRAAIVTAVDDSYGTSEDPETRVSLCVVNPTGLFFKENLPFAETPTPGHWNWPPRTDTITVHTTDPAASRAAIEDEHRRKMGRRQR
ncbi:hypothetical protein SEA_PHLOP_77 [Gordonia phage Phlop]|uniref:Uncharacterized protein n=7 Tax=Wizardvirus TaxID=2169658 RepID=A0A890UQN0_9CAUD|nr:hypothetical protein BH794_gp76 [Gordonia phage Wizard]YP_010096685.1 hypothetical protein KNT95_gp80 [Gordonia phage Danyall]YP_010096779.1 hypothetical protein KNT96_gp79 [Gordonia phage KimmyK]YP_010103093.1 hypothetical protein KNU63_gp83 [Gordonia phage RogerDodger]YP_010109714.1 hypothetical protein KNV19_gp80 [Gordonia phage Portcullis]YP_010114996.1 hypothetical protein KNV78_gp77 [Gordonia phage Phlop]UVK63788.1 hypothetical protein SEA_PULLUMCAVEA_78 [Gordonia phage PullumCavea]